MTKIYNFFLQNKYYQLNKYIYCFFFGSILVLCLPPYNLWPLIFPSIAFLFFKSYYSTSLKESFLIGWVFGLAFFIFGLYWIFNSFLIRSEIFLYLIPFCLIILSSFLALFFGIITLLNYYFKKDVILSIVFFSIFWSLSEILRGYLLTGFPWNLLAHIWINYPGILQISSIIGAYGLSFITILIVLSFCVFFIKKGMFDKKKKYFFITMFFFFLFIIYFGENRLDKSFTKLSYSDSTMFRVVQPNINQKDKLNSSKIESNFQKIYDLSFKNKMGSLNESEQIIILWPETAIMDLNYLSSLPLYKKIQFNLKNNEHIISGSFREENYKKKKYYNSVVIIDKNLSTKFIYDKIHLVPFGEYTPLEYLLNKLGYNFFSLQRGNNINEPISVGNLPEFKLLICYEIIFPGKYTKTNNRTKFLLNLTNDAWFGKTSGPYQHSANSIFRAVEQGRHVIRVANTGISSSIKPVSSRIDFLKSADEGEMRQISKHLSKIRPPYFRCFFPWLTRTPLRIQVSLL